MGKLRLMPGSTKKSFNSMNSFNRISSPGTGAAPHVPRVKAPASAVPAVTSGVSFGGSRRKDTVPLRAPPLPTPSYSTPLHLLSYVSCYFTEIPLRALFGHGRA